MRQYSSETYRNFFQASAILFFIYEVTSYIIYRNGSGN